MQGDATRSENILDIKYFCNYQNGREQKEMASES
jgi:hypothetical protein